MIANRFKPMGLVMIGMTAAMGFYLISSRVASERTELEKVDRQILAAKKQIRQLQTEIGTRASMRQLEQWNGEVLALSAPDASQYVQEAALGHIDRVGITDGPRFLPAQMVTAMANTALPAQIAPAVVRSDAVDVSGNERRALVDESRAKPKTMAAAALAAHKPSPSVARMEKKLLDDGLLGELAHAARAEERKR
ncbi:hypothetical protein [Sphingobium boeckii]|uniref:Uncharacterized protein n=1 Tax=Sphingobium boeckii TaxID=1082345 RepID=A0A7W9AI65_9SPHN|nr:hypothetical protein [Sphingobium boeckii]MBB5686084.1 hypothetical protein [Sphingobium boeckii]